MFCVVLCYAMMNKVKSDTYHLRLAPWAAIDILHLLIRCVKTEMKTFTILPRSIAPSLRKGLNPGTQIQQQLSCEVHKEYVSHESACVHVYVGVCVSAEVQREAGKVWEVKLPNSSAAARELLTDQLGLIVCFGELGG